MKTFLFSLALVLILSSLAPAADNSAPATQQEDANRAAARFQSMNPDQNGLVNFENFQKRFPQMTRTAFDSIDTGKDGFISLEEWRAFSKTHGGMGEMGRKIPPEGMSGQMPQSGHGGQNGSGQKPLIMPPPAK